MKLIRKIRQFGWQCERLPDAQILHHCFIPLNGPGSSMSSFNGMVVVPTGPGLGMTIDPDYVEKHILVKA